MCGIAGFLTDAPFEEHTGRRILETFARALQHRGPDGEGVFRHGSIGLVHRRLAVIDPEGGQQPIVDSAGRALIANAEIYNYKQLRNDLVAEDPALTFSSNSDCAPILPLYAKYGSTFVNRLRGMFGLAIYEPADSVFGKERLILARDPFGIKPLYYAEIETGFFFASEIGALKQVLELLPGAHLSLCEASRNALLELQFIPGAKTIWDSIVRVLPGETIVVEAGKILDKTRRTALPLPSSAGVPPAPADRGAGSAGVPPALIAELDSVLHESVALHLQSDVPVGIFLSGGVDSTTLLTVATQDLKYPLHTFTIGFPDSEAHDEREQARLYATNELINHHETTFTKDDFWTLLPQAVLALDDPVADYAAVSLFKLASVAKDHVKVILSGEGGDEIFAGYDQYQLCLTHKEKLSQVRESSPSNRLLRTGLLQDRKLRALGFLEQAGVLNVATSGWRSALAEVEREEDRSDSTYLQRLQAVDTREWLPHDLLTKIDRCLMWHGIEGRTPLVDIDVAKFAFLLPDQCKISAGSGKVILRTWLQNRHPQINAFGRKRGFTVPVGEWISERAATIGGLIARQAGIIEICRPRDIESFFADLNKPERHHASWILLFYALWHQIHVLHRPVHDSVEETLEQ